MKRKRKIESWLAIGAIVAIIIAWFVGRQLEDEDILSSLLTNMPEIGKLEEIDKSTFKIFSPEREQSCYLTLESSAGYGGPLQMAVAVDQEGKIIDLAVVTSRETPSYLEKVLDADFLDKIIGRSYQEEYSIGNNIDAVSSATYSSRAILEASKKGNRYIAANVLGFETPKEESPTIRFGVPEIVLLILFVIGYFAHKKTFRHKKAVRWVTMLVGMFVLGFFYNKLFSLSMVNQLLLGYFPPLHSHMYWYLLLGGIFLVLTIDNKNPYCYWFCPFGAAQDCMGLIGGAKTRSVGKFRDVFKWALRAITFFASIAALILRNPGATSYEVFGTLFKLTGSNIQFAILGIVLVSSMFIKRPWCNYLCPAVPVVGHLSHIRRLIIDQWKRKKIEA